MTAVSEALSGKGHRDENFPVASWLLSEERRGPILAFYRFVRAADDVADHPSLSPETKLKLLDDLDDALTGRGPSDPHAEPLRIALAETGLHPKHALDLLKAFRLDARKNRYSNWSELMDYCALSAAPVGRFVLDVHGEDPSMWPASDAMCSALQIINHLQDCADDYRRLNRVYLPFDMLAAHGASVEMLDAPKASPPLLGALHELARRTSDLVTAGRALDPADQGCPPRRGDRRDPCARAPPRARSRKPRSVERARPPRQGWFRLGRRARRGAVPWPSNDARRARGGRR